MENENVFVAMASEAAQQTVALRKEIITNALDYFTADAEFCRAFEARYGISADAWMADNPEARAEADEFVRRVNAQFAFMETFFPGFRDEVLARLQEDTENGRDV